MARGAFPDSHPLHLGHARHARHGRRGRARCRRPTCSSPSAPASTTASPASSTRFAPDAKVIHADIDPAEISKNRAADVPIVGDCREVIADLIVAVQAELDAGRTVDYAAWWAQLDRLARARTRSGYDQPADGALAPQYVIERLGAIAGPDAIYAAGVGQHQMWAAQFIAVREARAPG